MPHLRVVARAEMETKFMPFYRLELQDTLFFAETVPRKVQMRRAIDD